jgi:hypothetical protein
VSPSTLGFSLWGRVGVDALVNFSVVHFEKEQRKIERKEEKER